MKSVVMCSSTKFKEDVLNFSKVLTEKGVMVYLPYHNTNKEILNLSDDLKEYAFNGLVRHHMDYIRKAEVCFIYNKDGYVGNSTLVEIGFATALNKPLYLLEKLVDPSINILSDGILSTPEELIQKLQQ
jgi:nucleoside 2-deoxyribosyltransferase